MQPVSPFGKHSLFPKFVPKDLGQVEPGPLRPHCECLALYLLDCGRHFTRIWTIRSQLRTSSCSVQKRGVPVLSHCHLSGDISAFHEAHFFLHPIPILCLNNRSVLPPPSLKVSQDSPFTSVSFGPLISCYPLFTSCFPQAHAALGPLDVPSTRRLRPGFSHRGSLLLHWASVHTSPPQRPVVTSDWSSEVPRHLCISLLGFLLST